MPRKTYKKRSYKRRTYKARRYRKRYYRRRFYKRSAIKKPEIHILKEEFNYSADSGDKTVGSFCNLTYITGIDGAGVPTGDDNDNMRFKIGNPIGSNNNTKFIEGRKIRLKYLYIKGYYQISGTAEDAGDNLNAKLYVFRIKRNLSNTFYGWNTYLDMPVNYNDASNWTEDNKRDILYKYDWKNDMKPNIVKRVKSLYKPYDNINGLIPFKIRIPLYDCVMTCDNYWDSTSNTWKASTNPSTNQILLSFITTGDLTSKTAEGGVRYLSLKTKLYYTDY